jgi:hypothetical protein
MAEQRRLADGLFDKASVRLSAIACAEQEEQEKQGDEPFLPVHLQLLQALYHPADTASPCSLHQVTSLAESLPELHRMCCELRCVERELRHFQPQQQTAAASAASAQSLEARFPLTHPQELAPLSAKMFLYNALREERHALQTSFRQELQRHEETILAVRGHVTGLCETCSTCGIEDRNKLAILGYRVALWRRLLNSIDRLQRTADLSG